jgi:hypothetical protein
VPNFECGITDFLVTAFCRQAPIRVVPHEGEALMSEGLKLGFRIEFWGNGKPGLAVYCEDAFLAGAMLETCGSAGKGVSAKEGVPSRVAES